MTLTTASPLRQGVTMEHTREATHPATWERLAEAAIAATRREVHAVEVEIVHREERVAAWTPQPIRKVDEASATAKRRR